MAFKPNRSSKPSAGRPSKEAASGAPVALEKGESPAEKEAREHNEAAAHEEAYLADFVTRYFTNPSTERTGKAVSDVKRDVDNMLRTQEVVLKDVKKWVCEIQECLEREIPEEWALGEAFEKTHRAIVAVNTTTLSTEDTVGAVRRDVSGIGDAVAKVQSQAQALSSAIESVRATLPDVRDSLSDAVARTGERLSKDIGGMRDASEATLRALESALGRDVRAAREVLSVLEERALEGVQRADAAHAQAERLHEELKKRMGETERADTARETGWRARADAHEVSLSRVAEHLTALKTALASLDAGRRHDAGVAATSFKNADSSAARFASDMKDTSGVVDEIRKETEAIRMSIEGTGDDQRTLKNRLTKLEAQNSTIEVGLKRAVWVAMATLVLLIVSGGGMLWWTLTSGRT